MNFYSLWNITKILYTNDCCLLTGDGYYDNMIPTGNIRQLEPSFSCLYVNRRDLRAGSCSYELPFICEFDENTTPRGMFY